jgi:hypothetical protein
MNNNTAVLSQHLTPANYCTNCGAKIGENEKFCTNCGTSFGQVATLTPLKSRSPRNKRRLLQKTVGSLIIGTIIVIIILSVFASLFSPVVPYTDNQCCDVCGLPFTTSAQGYIITNNGSTIHEFCFYHSINYVVRQTIFNFGMVQIPASMSIIGYMAIAIVVGTLIFCWILIFVLFDKVKHKSKLAIILCVLWIAVGCLNWYQAFARIHPEAFGYSVYSTSFGLVQSISDYPFDVLFMLLEMVLGAIEIYLLSIILWSKNYQRVALVYLPVSIQVVVCWLNYYFSLQGSFVNTYGTVESPIANVILYFAIAVTAVSVLTFTFVIKRRKQNNIY